MHVYWSRQPRVFWCLMSLLFYFQLFYFQLILYLQMQRYQHNWQTAESEVNQLDDLLDQVRQVSKSIIDDTEINLSILDTISCHFNFICAELLCLINSLWLGDAIWWHRTESTLAQAMACCLMPPSHYLNQCWLIISEILWYWSEGNFMWNA